MWTMCVSQEKICFTRKSEGVGFSENLGDKNGAMAHFALFFPLKDFSHTMWCKYPFKGREAGWDEWGHDAYLLPSPPGSFTKDHVAHFHSSFHHRTKSSVGNKSSRQPAGRRTVQAPKGPGVCLHDHLLTVTSAVGNDSRGTVCTAGEKLLRTS